MNWISRIYWGAQLQFYGYLWNTSTLLIILTWGCNWGPLLVTLLPVTRTSLRMPFEDDEDNPSSLPPPSSKFAWGPEIHGRDTLGFGDKDGFYATSHTDLAQGRWFWCIWTKMEEAILSYRCRDWTFQRTSILKGMLAPSSPGRTWRLVQHGYYWFRRALRLTIRRLTRLKHPDNHFHIDA